MKIPPVVNIAKNVFIGHEFNLRLILKLDNETPTQIAYIIGIGLIKYVASDYLNMSRPQIPPTPHPKGPTPPALGVEWVGYLRP